MDDKNIVIAAVGTIIYRWESKRLQILTGTRNNDPWKDYKVGCFSGTMNRTGGDSIGDKDAVAAAQREAMEGTGGNLSFTPPTFLGLYGPEETHGYLKWSPGGNVDAELIEPIPHRDDANAFLFVAFYCEFNYGSVKNNREIRDLGFENLTDLASAEVAFAFNQAVVLADFYKTMHMAH